MTAKSDAKQAAKDAGDLHYRGLPCKHGHPGNRFVSNGTCVECTAGWNAFHSFSLPLNKAYGDTVRARKEAAAAGEAFFYGRPCPSEHSGKRYTKDGKCVDCMAVRNRQKRPPELSRKYGLMSNYGMTPSDYDAMVASQNGRCRICRESGHKLVVDHCHATGRVRMLLCNSCNSGLGYFRDNPVYMRAAADVMEEDAAIAARQDPGGTSQAP